MPGKIHRQGDLDGACFLYSLANAFAALTGENPERGKWDKGIDAIEHPGDFLKGQVGTMDHYSRKPHLTERAADAILSSLCDGGHHLSARRIEQPVDLPEIAELIGATSVVIFWYKGSTHSKTDVDHWVCGVAVEPSPLTIHVACSASGTENQKLHEDCGRLSNDWIQDSAAVKIMPGFVFEIHNCADD